MGSPYPYVPLSLESLQRSYEEGKVTNNAEETFLWSVGPCLLLGSAPSLGLGEVMLVTGVTGEVAPAMKGSVHTHLQRESLFFTMTVCSRQLFTLCSFLDGSAGVWSQGAEIWT